MNLIIDFIKSDTLDLIDSRDLAVKLKIRTDNLLYLIDKYKINLLKIDELKEIELKRSSKKPVKYFYLTKAQALYIMFAYRPSKINKDAIELKDNFLIQMIKSFV